MSNQFDVIVIGSGFGGAVVAHRLAAAQARVLVLERGRRWTKANYPRRPGDPWLFDHAKPQKHNGWLDLRFFKRMAVIQGAGVGGGSLCYSSVMMEADPQYFEHGWPAEITYNELAPHYEKVRAMLRAQPVPAGQATSRGKLMRRAAEKIGLKHRFANVSLAVSFDPAWSYQLPDRFDPRHSNEFVNPQGQRQGTCIHLGNCDIGCDVDAKNTLDLNYIPAAEKDGAEVRPLHVVRYIEPVGTGYRVVFDRIENGRMIPGEEQASRVVLAAGSLGSTELLLRCRDEFKTLPKVSPLLGRDWSANANVLTPDVYPHSAEVHQGIGPTISTGLDFMDGSAEGQRFYIEDDGFPNLFLNALSAKSRTHWFLPLVWAARCHLRRSLSEPNPLGNVMVWLGEGIDAADGQLTLARRWLAPWAKKLSMEWNYHNSQEVIEAILAVHEQLSEAAGGRLRVPFYWRFLRSSLTVHPLGGCKVGNSVEDGVVNHAGEVFGYPNLIVADGAILPKPPGRNPSMTIAALAERISDLILPDPVYV